MPGDPETVTLTIDGDAAHAQRFGDGDQAILLVHGLASESRELGALPTVLADHGYTALAIDLRGHGKSQGARGLLTVQGVLEDLTAWRDHLTEAGCELAVVAGHSLGGAWAMLTASRLDPQAVAAICSPSTIQAELSRIEQAAYRVGGFAHRLANTLGYGELAVPYTVGPEDVLDDPQARQRMVDEGLIQTTIPLANVETLLGLDATEWASQATCPGLVAAARDDRVVDRENTRRLFEAYGGPRTWMDLEAPHSCFYGPTGKACAEEVAGWVDGVIA